MYWLPSKLHKRPYKARLIAISSLYTTTELPKLLTSCLTAYFEGIVFSHLNKANTSDTAAEFADEQ